jgi:hypothetical protein
MARRVGLLVLGFADAAIALMVAEAVVLGPRRDFPPGIYWTIVALLTALLAVFLLLTVRLWRQ